MASTVYKYEVALKATLFGEREPQMFTRTEHAFGVYDAMMQAVINFTAAHEGATNVTLRHIGPPEDLVRQAERQLSDEIARHVSSLGAGALGQAVDAAVDAIARERQAK